MSLMPETIRSMNYIASPSFRESLWSEYELKLSKYNVFLGNDDHVIGYNILYKSMVKLPRPVFDYLCLAGSEGTTNAAHSLPEQWIDALKISRLVVDSSLNEVNLIQLRYNEALHSSGFLSLTILPTIWCNLDCPYCFELKKPVFMQENVEKAISEWIRRDFSHKRQIHVAWFGGKPLLAKKQIARLSSILQGFSNGIGAEYLASITTNGYYLDSFFVRDLDSLSIKHVQVTFDGDKQAHDKFRKKRNGQGSFDVLVKNICSFYESPSKCKLTIRVNCCDDNVQSIPALLERFPPDIRSKTRIFFRWIWPNEASGYKRFSSSQSSSEPYKELGELYALARALGWHTNNPHENHGSGYCEVDFRDFYQITPDGNIFLCSHTYQPEDSIGNVCKVVDSGKVINERKVGFLAKWYASNPFTDEECLNCILLPTCNGGCRKERVIGKKQCMEEKYSMDAYVRELISDKFLHQHKT